VSAALLGDKQPTMDWGTYPTKAAAEAAAQKALAKNHAVSNPKDWTYATKVVIEGSASLKSKTGKDGKSADDSKTTLLDKVMSTYQKGIVDVKPGGANSDKTKPTSPTSKAPGSADAGKSGTAKGGSATVAQAPTATGSDKSSKSGSGKAAPPSPKAIWSKKADAAADNLAKDKELTTELANAAKGIKYLSEADLRTIVAIESSADKQTGKNKYGYAGLFQLGKTAAEDAGYDYKDVVNPKDWKTNVAAGADYLDLNAKRLKKAGYDITPLNVYMAHQQGATGAIKILKAVGDGSAKTTDANDNLLNNLPDSFVKGITDGGKKVTVQNFYDYWTEAFQTVDAAVNKPAPKTPQPK
jgi:hypothetical protein